MSVQRHDRPAPRIERTFTDVRANLPAESVSAFDAQFKKITSAPVGDFGDLGRFLRTWHGIVSRAATDPDDWALMHQEAAEIEAGTRLPGPPLAEVLARRAPAGRCMTSGWAAV